MLASASSSISEPQRDGRRYRRGQLRRCASRGLRCRGPLRRATGAGHDRGPDRPGGPAHGNGCVTRLSRCAGPDASAVATCWQAFLLGQFASGAMPILEFERDGEVVRIAADGPLPVRPTAAMDLAVGAELGIIHLFEEWLRPQLEKWCA
jgi:hypothetical protein